MPNEQNLNKITNRIFILSPAVSEGLDAECSKNDFNRDGDSSLEVGCFGKVWKVIHKLTGRVYVIKVIHKQKVIQKQLQNSINNQLKQMYKVNHPHMLNLLNHFEDEDNLYLILEYKEATSLFEKMNKGLNETQILKYTKQIIIALIYLNSLEIFNREISPESILVDTNDSVVITDYGWANVIPNEFSKRKSVPVIRIEGLSINSYTSPEEIEMRTNKDIILTNKTDQWRVGMLMYELFSNGIMPFTGNSTEEILQAHLNAKVSWEHLSIRSNDSNCSNSVTRGSINNANLVKVLITKLLRPNPNDRPTFEEILKNILFQEIELTQPQPSVYTSIINIRPTKINFTEEDSRIIKLKKENEILKLQYDKLKSNYDTLLKEYTALKSGEINPLMQIEDSFTFKEDLIKYQFLNEDRKSKISELEEKSEEILELRSANRVLENELELIKMNLSEFEEKNSDYLAQINKLTEELEIERTESREKASRLSTRIESLENKLFNNDNGNMNTEEFYKNFVVLLFDSVREFKELVGKMLKFGKEENSLLLSKFTEIVEAKDKYIKDLIFKTKDVIDTEILKKSTKIEDNTRMSVNSRMEWMQKQINELIPFKLKSINLEANLQKFSDELKLLTEKLKLTELEAETLRGIERENKHKIHSLDIKIENLENKVADTQAFVLKNFPDKLEEFFMINNKE